MLNVRWKTYPEAECISWPIIFMKIWTLRRVLAWTEMHNDDAHALEGLTRLSKLVPMAAFRATWVWIPLFFLISSPIVSSFLVPVGYIYGSPQSLKRTLSQRSLLAQSSAAASGASDVADDGLIIGLNKYSHDSAVCVLRSRDGSCLFAGEKERLTRRKHDGGDTADLVSHALDSIGSSLEDVRLVVSNNHHHRVAPFERRIPWSVAMGIYSESYGTEENLIPGATHTELSHHLAHAWSAAALAPFESGLIIVMDGMGESHGAMSKPEVTASVQGGEQPESRHQQVQGKGRGNDVEYYNDLRLMKELGAEGHMASRAEVPSESIPRFQQVPTELLPGEAYREAESAYTFVSGIDGGPPTITPIYKRWTLERSPPELYNHGFENMESLGAVYSRVSSHIFGDWNACGKVMGLAPWAVKWPVMDPLAPPSRLTSGSLLSDGADGNEFRVHWETVEQLPRPNELGDKSLRPFYAALAAEAQAGLEEASMAFITGLRERTGEKNLCLCGGVALNSVLNGKVAREAGFERVFVPPYPGDEGIAVGCAVFGWYQRRLLLQPQPARDAKVAVPAKTSRRESDPKPNASRATSVTVNGGQGVIEDRGKEKEGMKRLSLENLLSAPFWGKEWSMEEIEDELEEWKHWLEVRDLEGVKEVAQAIANGEVVAWFQGRSEFGPRALGSRSLLADPRDPDMPSRINKDVKKREDFRPFAPSVLAEEADDWFEDLPPDGSPYMSLTAPARPGVAQKVPAVCHVDGSSRLQTVREADNPLYHRLIAAFHALTGVPMVLNTSFNVMGEPIVNSPQDAIRALTRSMGTIGVLVLVDKVVTLRPFPPDAALEAAGREQLESGLGGVDEDPWDRLRPFQARTFRSEVTATESGQVLRARVQPNDGRDEWIDLDDHAHLDILELSGDGSRSLSEMIEEVLEEEMSLREKDEYEDRDLGANGNGDWNDDEEEAVASVTDGVLSALRSLYAKGLVGFY